MVTIVTGHADEAGHDSRCTSKTSRSCLLPAAGVLVVSAAIATVLYVELPKSAETSSINQQQLTVQEDLYSLGCYADDRSSRVMPYVYTDNALTPSVCSDHCEEQGYFYYALQSGVECWCGSADVEIDKYGAGICDYSCGGDNNLTCGGNLAFTAYAVAE